MRKALPLGALFLAARRAATPPRQLLNMPIEHQVQLLIQAGASRMPLSDCRPCDSELLPGCHMLHEHAFSLWQTLLAVAPLRREAAVLAFLCLWVGKLCVLLP